MADRPAIFELKPNVAPYPESVLLSLGTKSPPLFAMGNLDLLHKPGIGFCGSRHASVKGLDTAADCAEQAVHGGYTIISGNAAGVDFVAHHAALGAGGMTILVLPEGIDHFRIKKELRAVWDWDRVLVISQFEPSAAWKAYRAMARNEVIIALSRAMIVIEAGSSGGTLQAGLSTLSAGKPLFVAVYEDMGVKAAGNSLLLDKGASRLAKRRSTGRANLDGVCYAAEHSQVASPPPRVAGQPSLF
jgi:DNA processing protein